MGYGSHTVQARSFELEFRRLDSSKNAYPMSPQVAGKNLSD